MLPSLRLAPLAGIAGVLAAAVLAQAIGCKSEGGAGQPCECSNCSGSLVVLSPAYTCDTGLLANYGGGAACTCQPPNSVPDGGACDEGDNCAAGLVCHVSACTPPVGDGGSCNVASDCAAGLECTKLCGAPQCLPAGATCPDGGP